MMVMMMMKDNDDNEDDGDDEDDIPIALINGDIGRVVSDAETTIQRRAGGLLWDVPSSDL